MNMYITSFSIYLLYSLWPRFFEKDSFHHKILGEDKRYCVTLYLCHPCPLLKLCHWLAGIGRSRWNGFGKN